MLELQMCAILPGLVSSHSLNKQRSLLMNPVGGGGRVSCSPVWPHSCCAAENAHKLIFLLPSPEC